MKKLLLQIKKWGSEITKARFFGGPKNRVFPVAVLSVAVIVTLIPHQVHALDVSSVVDFGFGAFQRLLMSSFEILILPLAAALMALMGMLLDLSIKFSLHTAYIFSLSPAINLGWTVIRDICNMLFIFVLIYISIGTILKGAGFQTKTLLIQVIIAALLINFSLFATKVVIDASNIFGNWIYGGIMKTLAVNTQGNPAPGSTQSASLSGLLAERLGIMAWWDFKANKATPNVSDTNTVTDPSKSIIGVVLRLIIVLIATYVFSYCFILFMARSVTLIFLLVFSPIGFIGGILPQLKPYAEEWKNELLKAALFPISFLLMLYIALQFINSLGLLKLQALQDKSVSILGVSVSVSQYFQYILIIFILHSCLQVAKDNSGKMGKALGGMAEGLGKLAIGIGGGGAALLGKVAIGGAATRLANNTWLNQKVAGGGVLGAVAGGAQSRLGKVGDFHFDARAIAGIDFKGGKGYTSMMKDNTKQQEEAQKNIAAKPKDILPVKDKLADAEYNAYKEHPELKDAYVDAHKLFEDAKRAGRGTDALRKKYNEAEKDLAKIKTAIEQDGGFEAQKKILAEQEIILKTITDPEKRKAMEIAMRQGRAAKQAERGLGMDIANMAAGTLKKDEATWLGKAIGEKIGNTVGRVAIAGLTGTLSLQAGPQYVSDNKKIAGKLRDVTKEGDKKKQQEKISGILADLSGDAGGSATPAAAPASTPAPTVP